MEGQGEACEVYGEVVAVGQGEGQLGEERLGGERGRGHGVEGLLDREGVVLGEGGEQGIHDAGAGLGEVGRRRGVEPLDGGFGAEQTVVGFGQGGQFVAAKAGEG